MKKEIEDMLKDEEKMAGAKLLEDEEIAVATGGGEGGAGIGGGTPGSIGIITIDGGSITIGGAQKD